VLGGGERAAGQLARNGPIGLDQPRATPFQCACSPPPGPSPLADAASAPPRRELALGWRYRRCHHPPAGPPGRLTGRNIPTMQEGTRGILRTWRDSREAVHRPHHKISTSRAHQVTTSQTRKIEAHAQANRDPDDVAGAALFLASDDSAWVTGINLLVDGGYSARWVSPKSRPFPSGCAATTN
jgi:Enoyl-(Acyl carrier protein) reductase